MNGWKLSALKTGSATAMNSASASILIDHQDGVERCAFARAGDQQAGDDRDDEDRRQVDDAAELGPLDQRVGKPMPIDCRKPRGIARPADRDRADHQGIFEDQRQPTIQAISSPKTT